MQTSLGPGSSSGFALKRECIRSHSNISLFFHEQPFLIDFIRNLPLGSEAKPRFQCWNGVWSQTLFLLCFESWVKVVGSRAQLGAIGSGSALLEVREGRGEIADLCPWTGGVAETDQRLVLELGSGLEMRGQVLSQREGTCAEGDSAHDCIEVRDQQ